MGRNRKGRQLAAISIVVGAAIALVAPAAHGATDDRQRTRPPRAEVAGQAVQRRATPNSPWVITTVSCGTPQNVTVQGSQYFTLYAYGADGGENGQGIKGGGGSAAV